MGGAKKIYAKLSQAELPLTITFLKPKTEKPTSMNQVKSDSHDTPEPPRVSSQAPPADSPKAINPNSPVPAPKPPLSQEDFGNLVPDTPGGPDDDEFASPRAQALLDAFDEDAAVQPDAFDEDAFDEALRRTS